MIALGRAVAVFGVMMVAGYLAVVAFLPAPSASQWRPDDMTGASAAARLTQEAQSLASHRAPETLQ